MKFDEFLKANSLKEKEINIDGIDEKFKIRQLSMLEQIELMEKNGIELENESKLSLELIRKNSQFRKEIILKALLSPKIDEKSFDKLNQDGLNVLSRVADEILSFTNNALKQEGKGD